MVTWCTFLKIKETSCRRDKIPANGYRTRLHTSSHAAQVLRRCERVNVVFIWRTSYTEWHTRLTQITTRIHLMIIFLLVYFPFFLSQIHSRFHYLAAHNSATWVLSIAEAWTVANVLIATFWFHGCPAFHVDCQGRQSRLSWMMQIIGKKSSFLAVFWSAGDDLFCFKRELGRFRNCKGILWRTLEITGSRSGILPCSPLFLPSLFLLPLLLSFHFYIVGRTETNWQPD